MKPIVITEERLKKLLRNCFIAASIWGSCTKPSPDDTTKHGESYAIEEIRYLLGEIK